MNQWNEIENTETTTIKHSFDLWKKIDCNSVINVLKKFNIFMTNSETQPRTTNINEVAMDHRSKCER